MSPEEEEEELTEEERARIEETGMLEDGEEGGDDAMDDGGELLSHEQLGKLHDKMDKNGDGKVSIEEVKNFNSHIDKAMADKDTPSIFREYDKNGDGKVTVDEWGEDEEEEAGMDKMENPLDDEEKAKEAEHKGMQKNMFKAADHNGDGSLTIDEFCGLLHPETNHKVLLESAKMVMNEKDLDKDGKLTMSEFFERHDEPPEMASDAETKEALDEMQEEEKQSFEWLDKDKDGKLDIHELLRWESGESTFHQSWQTLFKFTDQDKDDHITKKEFVDAHPQIIESEAHNAMQFWNEHLEL